MFVKIDHTWRWCGTAFSFLVFGLGGVLVSVVFVPVLLCLPGDKLTREMRTQRFYHRLLRIYVEMMRVLGVLTYQIEDRDKLKGARLIVANHPSLLDVVFLISIVPNANCIVKGKLTRNFFLRGPVKAAGYIINESASDVIAAAADAFDNAQSLIIFPEGTRTSPHKMLQFKRGAANVAVRTGSDITPVLIYCKPTTLTKNEKWYHVPSKRMHFRILVRDQIRIDQYLINVPPSMGARNLTNDLIEYFDQELKAHG